jgi:hypothetical protein
VPPRVTIVASCGVGALAQECGRVLAELLRQQHVGGDADDRQADGEHQDGGDRHAIADEQPPHRSE